MRLSSKDAKRLPEFRGTMAKMLWNRLKNGNGAVSLNGREVGVLITLLIAESSGRVGRPPDAGVTQRDHELAQLFWELMPRPWSPRRKQRGWKTKIFNAIAETRDLDPITVRRAVGRYQQQFARAEDEMMAILTSNSVTNSEN